MFSFRRFAHSIEGCATDGRDAIKSVPNPELVRRMRTEHANKPWFPRANSPAVHQIGRMMKADAIYLGTSLQPSPGNRRSSQPECPLLGKGRAHCGRSDGSRAAHQPSARDQARVVEDPQPSRRSQGLVGARPKAADPSLGHESVVAHQSGKPIRRLTARRFETWAAAILPASPLPFLSLLLLELQLCGES